MRDGLLLGAELSNPTRPGALLARRIEEGMEADDLLCSRNARSQTPLVERAQWKLNQPPSLERERAGELGGSFSISRPSTSNLRR